MCLILMNYDRFGWIRVHNKQATWNSINPWMMKSEALLELLSQVLNEEYEQEDYGHIESFRLLIPNLTQLGELLN
jgi:hypothetical protein